MCTEVTNTDTNQTAETVSELLNMLNIPKEDLVLDEAYTGSDLIQDACLCQINCQATAERHGYEYTAVDGDYMNVEIHKKE